MSSSGCVVCGREDCATHPEVDYLNTYPFLPGGREKVPGREGFEWVTCTQILPTADGQHIEYGLGDRIPMDVAIARGICSGPLPEPAPPAVRGTRRAV